MWDETEWTSASSGRPAGGGGEGGGGGGGRRRPGEGHPQVSDASRASREADAAAERIGSYEAGEEGREDPRGQVRVAHLDPPPALGPRGGKEDGGGDGAWPCLGRCLRVVPGGVRDVAPPAAATGAGAGAGVGAGVRDDAHPRARPAAPAQEVGGVAVQPRGSGHGMLRESLPRRRGGRRVQVHRQDVRAQLLPPPVRGQEDQGGAPPVGTGRGPDGSGPVHVVPPQAGGSQGGQIGLPLHGLPDQGGPPPPR